MAYGIFGFGLVLGWSALFLRGSTATSLLVRLVWLALLAGLVLLSPDRAMAAWGIAGGALAHFVFQRGLEANRA
jgi:hypothetical protein